MKRLLLFVLIIMGFCGRFASDAKRCPVAQVVVEPVEPLLVRPVQDDMQCRLWVDSVLDRLSLKERVGQLFIYTIAPHQDKSNRELLRKVIEDYKVGGLLFSGGLMQNQVVLTNEAQRMADIPLLITFDGEWGLSMRLRDTPAFPKNMVLGCIQNDSLLYEYGCEMAFELQAKLLRILETGEYIKIGDTKPTHVNVRIIAATNRNLPEEIAAGRFREDLFYRLSVFQIHLPPLRERAGDVRILAKAFIKDFSGRLARPVTEITSAFFEALEQQPWKGNIRELRNVIERSLIVCEGEGLDVADLPLDIQNAHYEQSDETSPGSFELSAMERRHIARVLEYTKGNKTEAARLLKIGLTTLYRKIEEYGI